MAWVFPKDSFVRQKMIAGGRGLDKKAQRVSEGERG